MCKNCNNNIQSGKFEAIVVNKLRTRKEKEKEKQKETKEKEKEKLSLFKVPFV